jgi:hypothetical protein
MIDSILAFLRKLQVESQVHHGVDIANLVVIIVLLCAFYVALSEHRLNRRHSEREQKISREASAIELYREYLRVALEYPELSSASYNNEDPIWTDKYDTFLSITLLSFDECVIIQKKTFFVPL